MTNDNAHSVTVINGDARLDHHHPARFPRQECVFTTAFLLPGARALCEALPNGVYEAHLSATLHLHLYALETA